MKRIFVLLFLALFASTASNPALADFNSGKKAYDRGDFAVAAKLWRQAGQAGDAKAQTNLGVLYASGRGVEKDAEKSVFWYRKAAIAGYPKGQY
ncbi:MAG: hypothetical protein QF546_14810 [Alphaproteobacteria bacterium]|jgi:hypothetical protein|nr:hypothetical protein [Alphaproteobacteria bacterium]HJP22519.1 hypothetical protein [Alphaproteobacteria bacterium]